MKNVCAFVTAASILAVPTRQGTIMFPQGRTASMILTICFTVRLNMISV